MDVRCRKNQASLSPEEKGRFVNAVIGMKANGSYDNFVRDHTNFGGGAHSGPAFLPWHREFINRFEQELQKVDASVTLPYWDWTVDRLATSSIWNPDFMGGNGRASDGQVVSGPFAFSTGDWPLIADGPALRRRFGLSAPALPTSDDVAGAMAEAVYDISPWNSNSSSGFRNRLEGWINGPQLHNLGHVWVGGSMLPTSSPNDPVFFLHHCFIDKLWADWQRTHSSAGYLPVTGAMAGHNLNDPMAPFSTAANPVRPADTLDHHAMGYAYDNEGLCQNPIRGTLPSLDIRKIPSFDTRPSIDIRKIPSFDTRPVIDIRKRPGFDTRPNIDWRKSPALDKNPITDRRPIDFGGDPIRAGFERGAAPFVLATPHHTMAWTESFPDAVHGEVQQIEEKIGELNSVLHEMDSRSDQLFESDLVQMNHFQEQLDALMLELARLSR